MTLLQYASVGEIAQCLVALVGVLLSQREVWRNVISLIDLTDTPLGDLRRLVALKNVSVEMILALAQGVLFIIGIISLVLPPPPASTADVTATQSVIIHVGMMLVTALLTSAVYAKVWLDARFLRMIPPPPERA
jgi:hypothetical protein